MSQTDIVRAWKDEEYRTGLSPEQRSNLPPHPSGVLELSDAALSSVAGGTDPLTTNTWPFSPLCLPPPDWTVTPLAGLGGTSG